MGVLLCIGCCKMPVHDIGGVWPCLLPRSLWERVTEFDTVVL